MTKKSLDIANTSIKVWFISISVFCQIIVPSSCIHFRGSSHSTHLQCYVILKQVQNDKVPSNYFTLWRKKFSHVVGMRFSFEIQNCRNVKDIYKKKRLYRWLGFWSSLLLTCISNSFNYSKIVSLQVLKRVDYH